MPTITNLEVQKNNKNRVNIYIDGEFWRGAEAISVVRHGLKMGMEVSVEQLTEAITDSECERAFLKASEYLSRAMHTVDEMNKYLTKKGYDSNVVQYVTDKLKGYGYLDDERYARMYAEQFGSARGQRRIAMELQRKGVGQTIAEKFSAQDSDVAVANANAVADKYMRNKTPDTSNLVKLQRHLLSRGYDFDTVNSVVNRFRNEV